MFTNSQASWDCGWVVLTFCGEEGVTSDQLLLQTGEWLYFRSLDALAQKQFSMIIVSATHYFVLVFVSETCVFAYLGMAIFSFKHQFRPAFVIWTIVSMILCIHFVHFILLHSLIYRGDLNNNLIILCECWEFRVMPTKDCVSIIAIVMFWTS